MSQPVATQVNGLTNPLPPPIPTITNSRIGLICYLLATMSLMQQLSQDIQDRQKTKDCKSLQNNAHSLY